MPCVVAVAIAAHMSHCSNTRLPWEMLDLNQSTEVPVNMLDSETQVYDLWCLGFIYVFFDPQFSVYLPPYLQC